MLRADYPGAIKTLIAELKRMPGVGPRSAERIAIWMIQSRDARPLQIAGAIREVTEAIRPCPICGFFTSEPLCIFCSDSTRDPSQICVVEQPTEILSIERTGVFRGQYHVLGGRISPLDHIGPDELRIATLIERIKAPQSGTGALPVTADTPPAEVPRSGIGILPVTPEGSPREIILALGSDVEGEATANYLAEILRDTGVKVTRLAQGLPAGGGLEYADELTLSRALSGRTNFGRG